MIRIKSSECFKKKHVARYEEGDGSLVRVTTSMVVATNRASSKSTLVEIRISEIPLAAAVIKEYLSST